MELRIQSNQINDKERLNIDTKNTGNLDGNSLCVRDSKRKVVHQTLANQKGGVGEPW